jgi:hypothetical protein
MSLPFDYSELARALIREGLPQALAAQITPTPSHPEWADKTCNPFGTERAFLEAARRGDFPSFRRARRITARWADVSAAIERSKGARRRTISRSEAAPQVDIAMLVREGRPTLARGVRR